MSQGDGAKVQSYGFEADIWSFGMVLYELLTMKRPYHDVSPFQISESNAQGLRPALTPDVDENEYKVRKMLGRGNRSLTILTPCWAHVGVDQAVQAMHKQESHTATHEQEVVEQPEQTVGPPTNEERREGG